LRDGLAAVRRALDLRGISIPLSGPDWTDLPDLEPGKIDFNPWIGAYDLHSYYARFDWMAGSGYSLKDAEERLSRWRQWSAERGKPLFLSELGSMVFGWGNTNPGPRSFLAAIKDAELVVRALNLGVDGFNRWSFINRGDLDGQWQLIETWDRAGAHLRQEIIPAPNGYFVYGLLSRLTAKHSQVLGSEVAGGEIGGHPRVFAAALRSPRGHLTLAIVNDAPQPWPARLEAAGIKASRLFKYQVSEKDRDQPGLLVGPVSSVAAKHGRLAHSDTLPPMSLTLFSSYNLDAKARGIIAE
jgi:hypothetical protein